MVIRTAFVAILAATVAACSTTVGVEQSLDYPAGPLPANFEAVIAPNLSGGVVERISEPRLIQHRTGNSYGGMSVK